MTAEKPHCCEVAKQWGKDYWDGDRKYGYGGYRYDGRWSTVAKMMVAHYGLTADSKIFDIGCGKGHLAYEISKICNFRAETLPVVQDISFHAFHDGIDDTPFYHREGHIDCCTRLPNHAVYDGRFDFVYSINVFHNLKAPQLKKAVQEMMRVSKAGGARYICVESYRNEQEKFNLQCWALTCEQFHDPDSWKWLLKEYGYDGDIEFIFFE